MQIENDILIVVPPWLPELVVIPVDLIYTSKTIYTHIISNPAQYVVGGYSLGSNNGGRLIQMGNVFQKSTSPYFIPYNQPNVNYQRTGICVQFVETFIGISNVYLTGEINGEAYYNGFDQLDISPNVYYPPNVPLQATIENMQLYKHNNDLKDVSLVTVNNRHFNYDNVINFIDSIILLEIDPISGYYKVYIKLKADIIPYFEGKTIGDKSNFLLKMNEPYLRNISMQNVRFELEF